jgi:hypothetical protein
MKNKTYRFPISLFVCLLISGIAAQAQQVRYGMKAGLGLTGVGTDFGDFSAEYLFQNNMIIGQENDLRIAFHLMGFAELDLHENFGAGAGLLLATRGFRIEAEGMQQNFTSFAARPFYAQIPIYGQFRARGFYLNFGPYAGMGLTGNAIREVSGTEDANRLEWGNGFDSDLRRFDFGAMLEAGASYRNVRLSAGYHHGFANLIPKDWLQEYGDLKMSNRVYYVSAGYIFSASR